MKKVKTKTKKSNFQKDSAEGIYKLMSGIEKKYPKKMGDFEKTLFCMLADKMIRYNGVNTVERLISVVKENMTQ